MPKASGDPSSRTLAKKYHPTMRSYPILYLTLVIICAVFAIGGGIGLLTQDPHLPTRMSDAGLYYSMIPISMAAFGLFSVIFWIIALIHLLKNPALMGTDKIVWLLVVIFLNALGGVLYFWIAPNPALMIPPSSSETKNG
ncbi:MAG: PLD nuclease N-terminal domain-containing protein [bacterium]